MNMPLPKFYGRIAALFFFGGIAFFISIFYFMLGKAEIVILPTTDDVAVDFIVEIREQPFTSPLDDTNIIDGKIYEQTVADIRYIATTGEKKISSGITGKVEIINNTNQNQTLVATTRLLSQNGVLMRMNDRVIIPKGERVAVSVYPDDPSNFSELAPTRFILPGLSQNLQDKIYGESTTKLSFGDLAIKTVTQKDFETLESQALDILGQNATDEYEKQLPENEALYTRLVQKEVVEKKYDSSIGDEKEQLGLAIKFKITIIAFDEKKLLNIVKKNIYQNISSGRAIKDFNTKDVQYLVQKYDVENKVAYIKVNAKAHSVIKDENRILNKKNFLGLSEKEAQNILKSYPEIQNAKINFYPDWIRRLPKSEERIDIIVQ